jgi:hypothetical protein
MSRAAQEKAAVHSRIDQVLKGLAPHHITVPRPEEVRAYIERHPEGISILVPVAARARQEFPDPAKLSLEVYADPETGEQDLKLYVRLAVYEPGMWKQLSRVCDPFEEDFAQIPSSWPHVTTDYLSHVKMSCVRQSLGRDGSGHVN